MAREFSQPELIGAILKWIDRRGIKTLSSRKMNAVIAGANTIIEAIDQPDVMASPGMGLAAWLRSDDTGLSSLYMAWTLAPLAGRSVPFSEHFTNGSPWPHDPADFGRCVRLLDAVPELRPHIAELTRTVHPAPWQRIAAEWDALEALYREELPTGKGPKLYERLQQVTKGSAA